MKKSWKRCNILPKYIYFQRRYPLKKCRSVLYFYQQRETCFLSIFKSSNYKKKKKKKERKKENKPKTKKYAPNQKLGNQSLFKSFFLFVVVFCSYFLKNVSSISFLFYFSKFRYVLGVEKMLSFWERSPVLAYSSLSTSYSSKSIYPSL